MHAEFLPESIRRPQEDALHHMTRCCFMLNPPNRTKPKIVRNIHPEGCRFVTWAPHVPHVLALQVEHL